MERRPGWWWRGVGVVAVVMTLLPHLVMTQNLLPPCDSEIFCHGELLKTVQMARLHNDSKYFVDMGLKNTTDATLLAFNQLMERTDREPSKKEVKAFVDEYFHEPGKEFEEWVPSDWNSDPEFLKKVVDPALEEWGLKLNGLWKQLGRKISEDVQLEPDRYSQIYVPNPVIVPGGRFREFYYWDSYWTIDALLLSQMNETVKGMLENFVEMVKEYGMVPNGGRIYYTRRSQPPYLIPMVKLYMDHTNDLEFLAQIIDKLEEEFLFWENDRSVELQDRSGKTHTVAQYRVNIGGPRPESYREDYNLAQQLPTEEQEDLYVQMKSGAESGWDYSTRWFINNNTNKGTLLNVNVTSIVPVDLNSLLCMNARILSQFYIKLGNYSMSKLYKDIADQKNETMAKIFWDDTDGTWYDIDINADGKRRHFYLSNIHPIWSDCYGQEGPRAHTIEKVIKYLKKNDVLKYKSGVPTSLEKSGQQWDFPNAWAPLQHLIIMGLYEARSIHHEAESLSFSLAEKWIRTNWQSYQQSTPHAMFEKYNVSVMGLPGGGGEYDVQVGFGWSNGVALRLLDVYGDRLTATTGGAVAPRTASLWIILLISFLPLGIRSLFGTP
ncbi:trehalase-like isoform X2 [Homarus americanus]|nr:trehalase-like isoform X2 [Homarus americanus]